MKNLELTIKVADIDPVKDIIAAMEQFFLECEEADKEFYNDDYASLVSGAIHEFKEAVAPAMDELNRN